MTPGPFLVLPILGPSSARDGAGIGADFIASSAVPGISWINDQVYIDPAVYGADAVDQRHQVGFRYYQSSSPFEYDLVRFIYTKKRELDILR